tara:strand:+ start:1087 stop:1686 length:600 start_codon:yes stop_codon:yes gene_type:complete
MMPFDAYRCYLSLKNHFTKDHYDYIKYRGKTRATKQAFYKRKDRFWFEKFARQKNDKEVEEFFVSNFIYSTDPSTMWIGEMIKEGEGRYVDWKKKVQSLSYLFKEETSSIFKDDNFDSMFYVDGSKHPDILKEYLGGNVSLETMVICDIILNYRKEWDKKLNDPVWETVSRKIKKYKPFLNIDVPHYKKILKEIVIHDS